MKPIASFLATALVLSLPLTAQAAPSAADIQAATSTRAEYQQAMQAIEREDWNGALKALRDAERLEPQNADVQNMLGFTLRQKGDLDAALEHYQRAIRLNPYHRGAHEYMGRAYLYMGKPEQARELLAKLESLCMGNCTEYASLQKAIAEWDPWKRGARGAAGRSY